MLRQEKLLAKVLLKFNIKIVKTATKLKTVEMKMQANIYSFCKHFIMEDYFKLSEILGV